MVTSVSATGTWSLELLGTPRLSGPQGPLRLERRTAALLAYVALEGPQSRERLASLLWPDSAEKTARGNLRQLLHRLKDAANAELVEGASQVALSTALEVDALELQRLARLQPAGDPDADARFASVTGALLEGISLDDAPDLHGWLYGARDSLERLRLGSLERTLDRLEASAAWTDALALAQRTLQTGGVLSEPLYRRVMQLQYMTGDRAAALGTYERLRSRLREELDVEPTSETRALMEEIARGRKVPARSPRATGAPIPLSIQRPPLLAGREREWARMEQAWEAGQGIIIGGAPGMGKTRLMQDFLSAHGRPLYFSARPGDRAVPYGTHARTYREMLDTVGGESELPRWVRQELSRIVPTLGEPPPPLRHEEDKLRFWNAKIEAHRHAFVRGYDALGFDDLQYVDPASAQAGAYLLAQLQNDPRTPIRTVHCYRLGELPPDILGIIREGAAAGILLHLELEPLSDEAARSLLRSLAVPGLEPVEAPLIRYAGGSPLFLLETVKHLVETGELHEGGFPSRLPPPGKVGAVLQRRLERLPSPALQLARAVSVLGSDFSLELAARLLESSVLELARAWTDLEDGQIVRGSGFTHDLIAEAVEAGTPEPIRVLLHRRAAQACEDAGLGAARVASHWLKAGDTAQASQALREAERASRASLLEHEATGYFQGTLRAS